MIVRASLAVKGHSPENLASLVAVSSALHLAVLCITGDRELEIRTSHEKNAYFGRMLKVGQPDAEIPERTGFDHGGMVSPAFPSLPGFVKKQNRRQSFGASPSVFSHANVDLRFNAVKFLPRDGSNGISDRFPSFFYPAIHHVRIK